MNEIDLPNLKSTLWGKLSADLAQYLPQYTDDKKILCPACLRPLRYEEADIEHILPKQALKFDPVDAKAAVSQDERAAVTLLCRKPLSVGKRHFGNGCNGWKGRYYDDCLKDLLGRQPFKRPFMEKHIISAIVAGYLGLFVEFGYRIPLMASGYILRRQYFSPERFTKELPLNCQVVFSSDGPSAYSVEMHSYWGQPIRISIERSTAFVMIRNQSVMLPLSSDPRTLVARHIPYLPSRFALRPDLRKSFD